MHGLCTPKRMKSQILESKYFLRIGSLFVFLLLVVAAYYILIQSSEPEIFVDRFEYRGLSRTDAEKRGILGLPFGISSYFIKRCSFRDSWIVFSKYKIKDSEIRKGQIQRFRKNSGLNKRFNSYPSDWPQNFDKDNCKPDWWEPCSQGEWAEIGGRRASEKHKDGFYLCEWEQELRWFVFHFRNIE